MSGSIVTLRGLIYTAIEAERVRVGTTFPYTGFSVEQTHLPYDQLTAITAGRCSVLGLANDYNRIQSRCGKVSERMTPINIAYRQPCKMTDVSALDTLVDLIQEIEECVIANVTPPNGYQFIKLESLKDENKTPFVYTALREASMFEAYFIAYYQQTISFT